MTQYPYILFNKSPEQMRQLGACGGRAYGRNERARRALLAPPPQGGDEQEDPQAEPGAEHDAEREHGHTTPRCVGRYPASCRRDRKSVV